MEFQRFSAKTVSDAVTAACQQFLVTSDKLEYEVLEEGSTGFLGFNAKPAVIQARVKLTVEDKAVGFLNEVFAAMNLNVVIEAVYNELDKQLDINLNGDEMGILIGKRGQTLDSLQYLVSLVVNKEAEEYIRVKVDTENYRKRRRETLENLAKNIAYKVKRSSCAAERQICDDPQRGRRALPPCSRYPEKKRRARVSAAEGRLPARRQ